MRQLAHTEMRSEGPRVLGIFVRVTETHLSPQAHQRLVEELEDLTTRGRVEIARQIEAARALGDLSENGDYHAAKDAQGKMESRIRQLQAMLASAVIVDPSSSSGEIVVGSVVGIRYAGDDNVEKYLVGSIEERPEGIPVISVGSPLGQALLGRAAGDKVSYEAPNGALEVEIVAVS
ncbi:MAG: transcription elongation factor GreA [Acidimicrobiales bacterium]